MEDERVLARPAPEDVVTAAAFERVVAGHAAQVLRAARADEVVVAAVGEQALQIAGPAVAEVEDKPFRRLAAKADRIEP